MNSDDENRELNLPKLFSARNAPKAVRREPDWVAQNRVKLARKVEADAVQEIFRANEEILPKDSIPVELNLPKLFSVRKQETPMAHSVAPFVPIVPRDASRFSKADSMTPRDFKSDKCTVEPVREKTQDRLEMARELGYALRDKQVISEPVFPNTERSISDIEDQREFSLSGIVSFVLVIFVAMFSLAGGCGGSGTSHYTKRDSSRKSDISTHDEYRSATDRERSDWGNDYSRKMRESGISSRPGSDYKAALDAFYSP